MKIKLNKAVFFWLILSSAIDGYAKDIPNEPPPLESACLACHNANGVSLGNGIPNLAGQHAPYLLEQMRRYVSGERPNPIMKACLANLTDQDLIKLADFYAKQEVAFGTTPVKALAVGERLYRGGNFEKGIPACIACHGPQGTGNAQAGFPLLSGQQPTYTVAQLKAFQTGQRHDKLGIMPGVSAHMSPDEMEAVAQYIQGLY